MSDASERQLAKELERLGIDVTTPEGRKEFRETFAWATAQRRRCQQLGNKAAGTILVLTVAGAAGFTGQALWAYFKKAIGQ